jgi:hypothetical protein
MATPNLYEKMAAAQVIIDKLNCSNAFDPANVEAYLLAAILKELVDLNASGVGGTKFEITPYTLTTVAQKILPKEPQGRTRDVSIWIDAASGGPTPTIRIGSSSVSAGGAGVRVNAGQVSELGRIEPNAELYAAASTDMNIYVIERA